MEKVSAIIPVYNASKYISTCVKSLIRQSYQNIEILLIDDYSSDNSLAILRSFLSSGKVKVFQNKKNLGLGITRNTGIRAASGKYICFVDADDWIDEGYIEGLVKTADKTNADLVITSYRSQQGQRVKTRKVVSRIIEGNKIYPAAILNPYRNAMPSVCTKIYRKQIIDRSNIFFSSVRPGEDLEFNLKYMFECQKVVFVPLDSYYYYRKDVKGSISSSIRTDYIFGYRQLINTVLSHGRQTADLSWLRQLRAYELYKSCIRTILRSDLSSHDRLRAFSELEINIRPLVCSGTRALLILLFMHRFGFEYRFKKIRNLFFRNMFIKIKCQLFK